MNADQESHIARPLSGCRIFAWVPKISAHLRKSAARSERNIPMLLRRVFVALGLEHLQRVDQLFARFARLDDGVHVAALGGNVRIGKALAKFFDLLLAR